MTNNTKKLIEKTNRRASTRLRDSAMDLGREAVRIRDTAEASLLRLKPMKEVEENWAKTGRCEVSVPQARELIATADRLRQDLANALREVERAMIVLQANEALLTHNVDIADELLLDEVLRSVRESAHGMLQQRIADASASGEPLLASDFPLEADDDEEIEALADAGLHPDHELIDKATVAFHEAWADANTEAVERLEAERIERDKGFGG